MAGGNATEPEKKELSMNIKWDKNRCYACGTCQLICSFHHTGTFRPDRGSIVVLRNPQDGSIRWRLNGNSCDDCPGEETPLCVKYCVYDAIGLASNITGGEVNHA